MKTFTITRENLLVSGAYRLEVDKLAPELPITLTDCEIKNAAVLARRFKSLDWAWTMTIASYVWRAAFSPLGFNPYAWDGAGWGDVFDAHGRYDASTENENVGRQNLGLLAAYCADLVGSLPEEPSAS